MTDSQLTDCVVFDFDGTLADTAHHAHYVMPPSRDFAGYRTACENAPTIIAACQMYHLLALQFPIFICTARSEILRPATEGYLYRHGLRKHKGMLMRQDDDHSPPPELKKGMILELRRHGFNPVIAFEDQPDVVKMWRENGVHCFETVSLTKR